MLFTFNKMIGIEYSDLKKQDVLENYGHAFVNAKPIQDLIKRVIAKNPDIREVDMVHLRATRAIEVVIYDYNNKPSTRFVTTETLNRMLNQCGIDVEYADNSWNIVDIDGHVFPNVHATGINFEIKGFRIETVCTDKSFLNIIISTD